MSSMKPITPSGGGLRPCEVEGQACYFHRFVEEEKGVLVMGGFWPSGAVKTIREAFDNDGIVPCGCEVEKLRHAYALVEFPDGSLRKVEPETVRFTDRAGEGWVSVKDALPEPLVSVLVAYEDGTVYIDWASHSVGFAYSNLSHGEVTHWRLLPEPPVESEDV